jgi:hypothetical protein
MGKKNLLSSLRKRSIATSWQMCLGKSSVDKNKKQKKNTKERKKGRRKEGKKASSCE